MANLQSSGAISIGDIKNLFGGPASPSLSNYYRGGAYIPSTKTVSTLVREPSSGDYYSSSAPAYGWTDDLGGMQGPVMSSGSWNGTVVFSGISTSVDSYTTGGYTYYQGSYREYVQGNEYINEMYIYGIYRTSGGSSTVSINTGIPSSGQISLLQFYGAEKP